MRGFIEERVEFRDGFAPRTEVYLAYTAWASVNGFHNMSAQRFYESFTAAAVDMSKTPITLTAMDGTRGYRGIVLN